MLLATGYAEAAAGSMAKDFPVIPKPYDQNLLVGAMAKVLGQAD